MFRVGIISTIILFVAAAQATDDQSDETWKPAWNTVVRDEDISTDLESSYLHVKTNSALGSDDKTVIWYYDEEGIPAGGIGIWFSSTVKYAVLFCHQFYRDTMNNTVPAEQDKEWIIEKRGNRTKVYCNGMKVIDTEASSDECYSDTSSSFGKKYPKYWETYWTTYWGRKVSKISFASRWWDTASESYYIVDEAEEWTECPVECGGGIQTRRSCTNFTPFESDRDCAKTCERDPCKAPGISSFPAMAGTKWNWIKDGINIDGTFEFFADGGVNYVKRIRNNLNKQGSWVLSGDGENLEINMDDRYHKLSYNDGTGTLIIPSRSPPSTMKMLKSSITQGIGCNSGFQFKTREKKGSICRMCKQKTYKHGKDTSPSCKDCPQCKISYPGSTSINDCHYAPCEPGYFMTESGCERCDKGYYNADGDSRSCHKCPVDRNYSEVGSISIDQCSTPTFTVSESSTPEPPTTPVKTTSSEVIWASTDAEPTNPPKFRNDDEGVFSSCGERSYDDDFEIVDKGDNVDPGEQPWMVRIITEKDGGTGNSLCGGSIIDEDWVLTAAHCVVDKCKIKRDAIKIYVGEVNQREESKEFIANKIIVHPHYDDKTEDHDIALIQVDKPFKFSSPGNVNKICLTPSTDQNYVPEDEIFTITGWGSEDSRHKILQKATVQLDDWEECKKVLSKLEFTNTMICSFENYACKGDSGGPLVYRKSGKFWQAGVMSMAEDCGDSNERYRTVFTNVTLFYDWIMRQIRTPCSAGSYMTDSGCLQCGDNTFSGAGASSCTSCPEGMVSVAGSTSQDDCELSG